MNYGTGLKQYLIDKLIKINLNLSNDSGQINRNGVQQSIKHEIFFLG